MCTVHSIILISKDGGGWREEITVGQFQSQISETELNKDF